MTPLFSESKRSHCTHCGAATTDRYCEVCGAENNSQWAFMPADPPAVEGSDLISSSILIRKNYFIKNNFWFLPAQTLRTYLRTLTYSVSIVLFAGFLLVLGLITGPVNREVKAFMATTGHLNKADHEGIDPAIAQYLSRYAEGKYIAQVKQLKSERATVQWTRELNRIEHLHSYPQRLQGLEMLLKDRRHWPPAGLKKLTARYEHYDRLIRSYQKSLQRADGHIEREYYTAAIYILKPMLDEGDVLGSIYEEASGLMDKAYLKKINYFLVKANFSQAKRALAEAKQNRVSERALKELDEKIKRLQALFPKGRGR